MLEWFYSCKGKQGKINVFCVQICFKKNIKTWKIRTDIPQDLETKRCPGKAE